LGFCIQEVIALLLFVLSIGNTLSVIGSDIGNRMERNEPFPDHQRIESGSGTNSDFFTHIPHTPPVYPVKREVTYNEDIVALIEQIDESTALTYIEELTSFGPRVTGTQACELAGDYIYDTFADMGLEVRYHYWSNSGYDGYNIEATLPGADPSSDEIYIICGHYDSVWDCPGADDNASGTAATMVAAEIMSRYTFNHTIRFVAFSGEEQWMLGSEVYVREASQNGDNIVAALNIDMIAYAESNYDRTHVKVYHDTPSYWIVDFMDNVAEEYYEYIDLDVIPSGFAYSDNSSFWDYGYHATFNHEWNFNPYYHTPNDVTENLDLTYEMRGCQLALATLAELAELVPLNVSIELTPDDPPVIVPRGGSFTYSGSLTNNADYPQTVDVWIMANVIGIGIIGPLQQLDNIPLSPLQVRIADNVNQDVPELAPTGYYNLIGYCGVYPSTVIDSSFFEVEVVP
jgi:hypothetical protein